MCRKGSCRYSVFFGSDIIVHNSFSIAGSPWVLSHHPRMRCCIGNCDWPNSFRGSWERRYTRVAWVSRNPPGICSEWVLLLKKGKKRMSPFVQINNFDVAQARTHALACTFSHARIHVDTLTWSHAHKRMHANTHTNTHTHTQTHTHTYKHTLTHTLTRAHMLLDFWVALI